MKNRNCLSEEELTLHYYGELTAKGKQEHLSGCPQCALRFSSLEKDLAKLPDLGHVPDALAGARMVARVGEQLNGRRKRWLPALGASAVTAFALVATISLWSTPGGLQQSGLQPSQTPVMSSIEEEMPEIDFLEDFELLKDLELLSQIEGV